MSPARVLLSAYQCAPGGGSVSQIGWEWYARLARRAPVTLVTHVRNRPALEASGAPLGQSEVLYIDTEWFAGPLYRLAKRLFPNSERAVFMLASLDFFLYDWQVCRRLRRRARRERAWDVVHAVTPVSVATPTRLHRLGLPLFVGPLNSGLRTPASFDDVLRREPLWVYSLSRTGLLVDRLLGSSRRAAAVLVATRATRDSLPPAARERSVWMLENGVDMSRFQDAPWPAPPSRTEPLRVLFVGRMIACKGVSMLLEAAAQVRGEQPLEVRLVGSGPMEGEWRQLATQLDLADTVHFTGAVPLKEVAAQMRWCHLFCLPSVRESGGSVLIEAMASARPVAAVLYGGPAEIVDDEVGRGLPASDAATVTRQLADVMRDVAAHPDAWRERARAARRRAVRQFDWDAKVETMLELYADAGAGRPPGSPSA